MSRSDIYITLDIHMTIDWTVTRIAKIKKCFKKRKKPPTSDKCLTQTAKIFRKRMRIC